MIQFIKLIHVEDRMLPLFIVQMQRHKGFFYILTEYVIGIQILKCDPLLS